MVCRYCGYQNASDAKYCSGCGRKLHEGGVNKKLLALAAVCLLLVGVGIGLLIPGKGTNDEKISVVDNDTAGILSKREAVEIKQVVPMEDGSVAVLYTDGTVRVSGNTNFSEIVSCWSQVSRLYTSRYNILSDGTILAGVTASGEVLTTAGNLSGWSNVKELHFPWQGIVGITHDGSVLTYGDWEDDSFFRELTDVDTLANVGEEWACLKKDGSVVFNYPYDIEYGYGISWTNVKELRASDHGFYAIMKDGTVEGMFDEVYYGLTGAVKVVDFEDWLFGISVDGRLLTHNGGNIYTNLGDMAVDEPGSPYYGGEIDIGRFGQVKDIVPFSGLILLNKDGTAEHIGESPNWDLTQWRNVRKVCGCYSAEGFTKLYAIQQDGSVIMHQYDWVDQTVAAQYRGWKLKDIYAGDEGVVGLTTDGKLVGDGIYEYVDFSVFEQ